MARSPVLPFSSGIWCPAARAPSWRGLNGLYTSPHERYDDDENDENAKRDQFSCNHTPLPDADVRRDNPTGGRISQRRRTKSGEWWSARC